MRGDVDGVFAGQEHPPGGAGPQGGVGREERGGLRPSRGRAGGVSEGKLSHLFDVDVVVEEDQVSPLLLCLTHS